MKVALTISHTKIASCFAGVELWVVDSKTLPESAGGKGLQIIKTAGWHPLWWGRELCHCGVELLFCTGISRETWAAVRGHGIEVIANVTGDPAAVLDAWRKGQLHPSGLWPEDFAMNGKGGTDMQFFAGCRRGRRRFRGGR